METVAIIGAGRMGSLLARKLQSHYNLILIDKDLRKCGLLAKEVSALATSDYSLLSNSDYIITALPANVFQNVVTELKNYVAQHHILINISTDTEKEEFEPLKGLCKIATAKIIGHAKHMAATDELPLVLIDGEDFSVRSKVASIFSKLGAVCFGDEKIVKKVNNIASEEGIKAALDIKKRLEEANVPSEYISFAIRNVACGTMSAFAVGEAGPFVQKIIQRLKQEQKTDSK
ncbi:MAG: NAD(P)-binding domain-containing protein [Thermoanaerobacteraceae bacterium]|mgnify:CR=1 FL=1|nr:NAD(P)-binding domain-containing protein [Thermoanaerobacteraceae bacterium]